MTKRISYSLFGSSMKYYVGAEKNIEINKIMLPEWETVIYYHPNMIITEYIQKLSDAGAKMIDVSNIIIGEKQPHQFPYFWRFISFFDDDYTLVRDLDSRVSQREVNYINKWVESDLEYFIIRDHPWHAPVPSGLFGMKNKSNDFKIHFNRFVKESDLRWGTDQEILHEYIEKKEKKEIFYCGYDINENYIPRNDINFFIGMQIDEYDNPLYDSATKALDYLNSLGL